MLQAFAVVLASMLAAFFDAREKRVPNLLTLPALATGLVFCWLETGLTGLALALLGLAFAYVLYLLGIWGAGDGKLFAALNAWLAPAGFFGIFTGVILFLASAFLLAAWVSATRFKKLRQGFRLDWFGAATGVSAAVVFAIVFSGGLVEAAGVALAFCFGRAWLKALARVLTKKVAVEEGVAVSGFFSVQGRREGEAGLAKALESVVLGRLESVVLGGKARVREVGLAKAIAFKALGRKVVGFKPLTAGEAAFLRRAGVKRVWAGEKAAFAPFLATVATAVALTQTLFG